MAEEKLAAILKYRQFCSDMWITTLTCRQSLLKSVASHEVTAIVVTGTKKRAEREIQTLKWL